MTADIIALEKRLWRIADELRANSPLSSWEYSAPVLGLIFLRYADATFAQVEKELSASTAKKSSRRKIGKDDFKARGVLYLPEEARFSSLLELPEGADIGKAINDAMRAIEAENEDLKGTLPQSYARLDNTTLVTLLKTFASIPMDIEGDAFGKIYEYFLGKFAMSEGRKGGEFFTPTSIVKLIVEVIEPFHGRILDPACGSGGMFVQSARFVQRHKKNPGAEISFYGQEKNAETLRLFKMNLAVHGLAGDVKQGNTYYENAHDCVGRFDFVMANPPFNVDGVDKDRVKDDPRYRFGIPRPDNANYLWIQEFYSALNDSGRAGFVMANSAADARGTELEIRRQLIESGAVDVMIAIGSNFFYTVTLPCTLWFFDKEKTKTERRDKVLFIDARHIYRQLDRAHRDFTEEMIRFIADIARLYRGEEVRKRPAISSPSSQGSGSSKVPPPSGRGSGGGVVFQDGALPDWNATFPNDEYRDVPGLCKVATIEEIEAQGWSLNPGRHVGIPERVEDEFDFKERLAELNEELEVLNAEARALEERIAGNVERILEA